MRCFTDDTLTELAMKSVAGEALGERELKHLDGCGGCTDALKRETAHAREVARAIQTANKTAPGPHLNDNDLSEFLEGALEESDASRVEKHLAKCRDCIASLTQLDELMQITDTSLSPVKYAIRLVKQGAEFITTPERGFRQSILAYVPTLKETTQEKDLCAWSQYVDGHPLYFKLQNGDGERIHLSLTVESRSIDPAKTNVTLRKDGDLIQSEALSMDRLVQLPNLRRGVYAFEIEAPEVDLRVEIDLQ